jgi:hypothetical protein
MSDDHFTVDGTLIQAWASQKSFLAKDGSDDDSDGTNFHGQKRSNQTHESTSDPDARLYKKSYGKESKLSYLGHALVENRNGLIAAAMATTADGYAEREAALLMLEDQRKGRTRRITLGADKAFDTKDFVKAARKLKVTVHVTKNDRKRRSKLDRRTTRHAGYAISLSRRWLVEKGFGWLKQTESHPPGEAARTAQGRLVVRLQLRRAQPVPTAPPDRPERRVRPRGELRPNTAGEPETSSRKTLIPQSTQRKTPVRTEIKTDKAIEHNKDAPVSRSSTSS